MVGSIKFLSLFLVLLAFSSWNNSSRDGEEDLGINWVTFEQAVELAKKEKKKIFIDVYTDWCGWCKKMDANTFSKQEIAKYMNQKFYSVKLNAEQKEDIVFNGLTYKFVPSGKRGYHQFAAALLNNRLSFPTVVFLDEDFNMLQPVPGYQQPESFNQIIRYFGDDHYKNSSWEGYLKTYKASF